MGTGLRTMRFVRLLLIPLAYLAAPAALHGQEPRMPEVGTEKLTAYARAYIAISGVRDELNGELGRTHDAPGKAEIRQRLDERILQILQEHEMTRPEYDRITFFISVDAKQRELFDGILAELQPKSTG